MRQLTPAALHGANAPWQASSVVACGPGAEPPRNVVLISVDTLAAEHLSAYGYEKLTSPRLRNRALDPPDPCLSLHG